MPGSIVRVGFACVTYDLGLTTNHNFRLCNLGPVKLQEAVSRNLDDLESILEWMSDKELRLFRVGSSVVPFASHRNLDFDWEPVCAGRLREIGDRYSSQGFRFSMHPGQYNVLNSPSLDVLERTVAELAYSCSVLDLMGLDGSHKVVIHGGGIYGDREKSLLRLEENIRRLPSSIKKRLVLENDDRHFSFAEIARVSLATKIPAIYDHHHNQLKPSENISELLRSAREVWNAVPEIHISSQKPDARPGAHDFGIHEDDLKELLDLLPFQVDLMVEAKGKEVAALAVMEMLKRIGGLA